MLSDSLPETKQAPHKRSQMKVNEKNQKKGGGQDGKRAEEVRGKQFKHQPATPNSQPHTKLITKKKQPRE